MGMITSKKVFVSSTTKDLWQYREEATKIIKDLSIHYKNVFQLVEVTMDTEALDGQRMSAIERSKKWVIDSDWIVLIVAWNYGYVPLNEKCSVTEWEYRQAEKDSKPCFVFLAGESDDGEKQYWPSKGREKINLGNWKEREKVPEDYVNNLKQFKDKLRQTGDFKIFSDLDDFLKLLESSLKKRIDLELSSKGIILDELSSKVGFLIREGNELESLFDKLTDSGLEFENCQRDILDWLERCVDYGRFLPDPGPDRRALQGRVDYWTSILGQKGIVVDIDSIAPFDPYAGDPLDVNCPYPGLKAYDENQQADFCGREKDTEDCVAHLEANRILMIVGGSGTGKSSLALAGVLSKLKSEHADWQFVAPFTPGAKPFESLGRAMANALGNSGDALVIADTLRQKPEQAALVLGKLFGADKPVMLLIDQFEELLTFCQDEQEQHSFSELLYGLVTQSDKSDDNNIAQESPCRILLTLRADHLGRFENNPLLQDLYRLVSHSNTKVLAAIDFEGIHRAIEIPAKKIGLRFLPPTIIDKLASQSVSLVDGLLLLQFALQRLWEERPTAKPRNNKNGNKIEEPLPRLDFINEETLSKLPDLQSALNKVAEEVFQLFDEEKQRLCQRLMLELVLLDENFEQPLCRRRSKAELLQILARHWPEKTVNEVIDVFVKQGLLRSCGGSEAQHLEAHEAMFRNWPRFRDWISGEGAKKRLHVIKLIGREALDWRAHEKSPDYLKLAGEPLKSAQDYVHDAWLVDKDSTDYVEVCYQQEQEIEALRQQAEQAKAEIETLEGLRKIETRNANAQKKNKWFALALACIAVVIIAASLTFWACKMGSP